VRGSYLKNNTQTENLFQIGSTDVLPLAFRMGLQTHATSTSRFGFMEVDDNGTKRNISIAPSGGNVGIGVGAGVNPGNLVAVGTNLFNIKSTGLVSIGCAIAPLLDSYIYSVLSNNFSNNATTYGIQAEYTSTGTANGNTHFGAYFGAINGSTSKVRNMIALKGYAQFGNDAYAGLLTKSVTGVQGSAISYGAMTAPVSIDEANGVYGSISINAGPNTLSANQSATSSLSGVSSEILIGGGTHNNAYLFKGVNTSFDIWGGTITNLYGINIPALVQGGTATVTNAYGAYIDNPTIAANNYCAYFGGKVGIGALTPTQQLEVNGGIMLNTATVQPACTAATRGLLWFVQSASGVKDRCEVCAKDAADVYAWRVIY
jgi:hypothetical protein